MGEGRMQTAAARAVSFLIINTETHAGGCKKDPFALEKGVLA